MEDIKTVALLPCPFCGSPAESYPDGDMEGYSIMCSGHNKGCPMTTFGYRTHEESVAAWNQRSASLPAAEDAREMTHEARRWCSGDGEWSIWRPCTAKDAERHGRDDSFQVRPLPAAPAMSQDSKGEV